MRSYGFGHRAAAEVLLGLAATGGFVLASRSSDPNSPWLLIATGVFLVMVAVLAGYYEPSAKRVWIHSPLIMSLELIALPAAYFTCKGFECGGVIGFLIMASLLACLLIVFSYVGFAFKRRSSRLNPMSQ